MLERFTITKWFTSLCFKQMNDWNIKWNVDCRIIISDKIIIQNAHALSSRKTNNLKIYCLQSFFQDPHANIISLQFFSNSEAFDSELLENREEMFSCYLLKWMSHEQMTEENLSLKSLVFLKRKRFEASQKTLFKKYKSRYISTFFIHFISDGDGVVA